MSNVTRGGIEQLMAGARRWLHVMNPLVIVGDRKILKLVVKFFNKFYAATPRLKKNISTNKTRLDYILDFFFIRTHVAL